MTTMDVDVHLGSGDVFWAVFWLSLWAAWVVMVVFVFIHVLRSTDIPGWGKAVWAAIILVVPVIGILAYLCVRGAKVGPNVTRYDTGYLPERADSVAGPGVSRQVSDLARLRDEGVISQSEFEDLRTRARP